MPNLQNTVHYFRQFSPRRRWAVLLCAAVFLFSGTMLLRDLSRAQREQAANLQLARQVRQARETPPAAAEASPYAENGVLLPYAALWEENRDMAGWLSIPETKIDYPVMYTPEEPEHYLRLGFDGEYAISGSLFIGEGCSPTADHIIIYGHAMKDGTMFGSLDSYADPAWRDAHPVIRFDTLTEEREYEVIAVFYSRVYTDQDAGVFRYYQYADLSEREVFEDYIAQLKASALYDTGVSAEYGDQLLTLSTCSYHTENGRFVVVARKVSD